LECCHFLDSHAGTYYLFVNKFARFESVIIQKPIIAN
jgi:hypothetical protein